MLTQLLSSCDNQDRLSGVVYHWRGEARGFTGLHGVAYLGMMEMAAAIFGMKERNDNTLDSAVLNNIVFSPVRSLRWVSSLTYLRDYAAHRYFLIFRVRYRVVLEGHISPGILPYHSLPYSSIAQAWKCIL